MQSENLQQIFGNECRSDVNKVTCLSDSKLKKREENERLQAIENEKKLQM